MELNREYKQIFPKEFEKNQEFLKGKIVDKVGFIDRGDADENIFAITFTDKTFIAIGAGNSEWDGYKDEPCLKNFFVINPKCYHSLDNQFHLNEDGNPVLYNGFVKVLADLGIWDITAEDLQRVKEEKENKVREWEYKQYLRLKEKFEK